MARRGVYKRGEVWWYRYADLTGKIVRKSSGSTKYSDAETLYHEAKEKIKKGLEPETQKIGNYIFEQLVTTYKKDFLEGTPSEKVKGYILDGLVKRSVTIDGNTFILGNLPLRRFDTRIMERLQKDLTAGGCADSYNNKTINTMKHVFTKAVDWGMVEEPVLKKIRKVKLFKEVGRLRYLSAQEAQALISVCDEHLKPIVQIALYTGMRRGEILSLKWEQVDLQHGYIMIPKTKNSERRDIPIDELVKKALNSVHRDFTGEGENKKLIPHVFHDQKTLKPYLDVKRSFGTACRRAGITDFHFHDCRHTYASLAMMSGEMDIATLSKLLGHKSLKMTMRYSHFAPAHMQKAAKAIEKIYGKINAGKEPTAQKLTQETERELAYVS